MSQQQYNGFAYQITRVPPELVHRILNDIPFEKLLGLISDHDVPYLEDCIISHFELGKVFSADFLAEVKALFTLYLRIRRLVFGHVPQVMQFLQFDGYLYYNRDVVFSGTVDTPVVQATMTSKIKAAILHNVYAYEYLFPVLRKYAPQPIRTKSLWVTETAADLKQIFDNLDAAETKLDATKAAQLQQMANIVQAYPGMVRTRWDFAQDHRRNDQHLINSLLQTSKFMQKRQIGQNRIVAKSIFSRRRPYLVPYDRLLRLFLKTMKKFPPIQQDRSSGPQLNPVPHQYPLQMKEVPKGLPLVYPRDAIEKAEKAPLRRIPYKKQSARKPEPLTHQPYFEKEPMLQYPNSSLDQSALPASSQELDWLEAFLGICQYMANMNEEWRPGQTVSDYWHTH